MTDYNDGKWHGWNGGECPVHPETVVEVLHAENGILDELVASVNLWDHENLIAFRVIKEYRESVITNYNGECHAYHYIGLEPTTASHNVGGKCVHGTWTATHVDGKLQSFTWKAT